MDDAHDPAAPLILTLALDEQTQGRFDRERAAYFPPERNYLSAHLTLFHHLPPEQMPALVADIEEICDDHGPLPLAVTRPFPLGRGVAYALESPALLGLHRELARRWEPWLTPQDRQPLRPHVTVQNKVSPDAARALLAELRAAFVPFAATGEGLSLWRYLGGPWHHIATYPFRGWP